MLNDEWGLDGHRWRVAGTVAADASEVIELPGGRSVCSIAVIPEAGGSALVEYSISPLADVGADNATWFQWPAGTVTAAAEDARLAPTTAFRITATSQPCRVEVLQ